MKYTALRKRIALRSRMLVGVYPSEHERPAGRLNSSAMCVWPAEGEVFSGLDAIDLASLHKC